MARKLKEKQSKKHVSFIKAADANSTTRPWPDLPQSLINVVSWQSALMEQISYGGVTKSSRVSSRRCNEQTTLPWLQVLYDGNLDRKFKFNISFHRGEWSWCSRSYPSQEPYNDYVGFSDGVLMGKGPLPSDYYLYYPLEGACYSYLPPWDHRVPFRRAVLSQSRPKQYGWRNVSDVMVITGISHPAFVFCRRSGKGKYGWIKQDCNFADPNCSNPSEHFMHFTNAIGYKDKFYALSLHGTLAVIEDDIDSDPSITGLSPKRAVPSVYSRHFKECLLESDGEILLVFLISRNSSVNIVDDVEVFRLDIDTLVWIKMERIGDKTLFLGSDCCISVSASKIGSKRDCVYFTHHTGQNWWVYDFHGGNISPCSINAILPKNLWSRIEPKTKGTISIRRRIGF